MFKSALANEMSAYLKLRELSVSEGAASNDRRALTSLDQHLNECGFRKKELTEEVLDAWMLSIPGKSKTVSEKVGAVRGFVKYLTALGIRSFLPDHPKVKSDYIRYIYSPDAYLFPGKDDEHHYTTRQVNYWFSRILKLAGIDQRDKQPTERGVCPHCLRHLFVLKSMQQLEAAGHPVDMNDLLLPTYLGHECLLDTDKYMRFSGIQLSEPIDAFETFTAGLIPQVEVPYEKE